MQLQSDLTRSLEATAWFQLFNRCGRYQQTILTALTLNPTTSAWLSTPPLTSEPSYRLRDEEYALAVRHRLGMLPYDDLRDELCVSCARRNNDTPALLTDPDHAHSCTLQQGASVTRRHDALKLALAELARACGYHVEVEPRFPPRVEHGLSTATGAVQRSVTQEGERGDLLLVRNGTRQLIDVTVVRPTSLSWLQRQRSAAGAAAAGSHMQPLVAAREAEAAKLAKYSAACSHAGWAMVPFALESYGAKGTLAKQLLQRMAAHSLDRSPEAFLVHADRVLSAALQAGNAAIAGQGTAELHLQTLRRGRLTDELAPAGRSHSPRKRRTGSTAVPASPLLCVRGGQLDLGAVLHAEYHCARVGVRQRAPAAA